MNRLTMLAVLALVATAPSAFAEQTPTSVGVSAALPAVGSLCHLSSTTDVTREAGWQTGVVEAGPLVGVSYPGDEIELYCTIQVNSYTHNGPDAVRLEAEGDGAVVLPPTLVNYQATAADDVVMCTEIWIWTGYGHVTLWWSGSGWSSSSSASCSGSVSVQPNDPECSIWNAIDNRVGTEVSGTWQDCEAYDEFPLPVLNPIDATGGAPVRSP